MQSAAEFIAAALKCLLVVFGLTTSSSPRQDIQLAVRLIVEVCFFAENPSWAQPLTLAGFNQHTKSL